MNPLLQKEFLIPFDEIEAKHIEPGIKEALKQAEETLEALLSEKLNSYESTLQALDDLIEDLNKPIKIALHLVSVKNNSDMRTAFSKVLPLYSAFFAKLPLNEKLWQRVKDYAESPEGQDLKGVYKRHLEKTLKEFTRAGANLSTEKKSRIKAIKVELNKLRTQFSDNVLDSTNAYELLITSKADLSGLPEAVKEEAKRNAQEKGLDGYRFTLQVPSYLPFMQYADHRAFRKELYEAYVSRASHGDLDNRQLMNDILALRQELASLLGYDNFAAYQLEERMIHTSSAALTFEQELYQKTLFHWQQEIHLLSDFAKGFGIDELCPWDVAYLTEKLRKVKYDLNEEELRPYFPIDQVLSGLFEISSKLFGISVSEKENKKVWHPDVKFYQIHDETGRHLASFYADWFPRENKRSGAWMNHFVTGKPVEKGFSPHLALMCGNFTKPQNGQAALLSHREVQTVFHEFGHLLHHCLSMVEIPARSGTHVAWDFVELPSQLMENWTWEREALNIFARHHQTGNTIPEALFQKLIATRTFMEANAQMRQLSFGTVDLELHVNYDPNSETDIIHYGNQIMERFTIRPEFAHNNFLASFSHIFSGGYAAGYYSYKWSEVLEADAFSRFKQEGIFNRKTGKDYVEAVLSKGDSDDPAVLFRQFMGRDPNVDALLERNLGAKTTATSRS